MGEIFAIHPSQIDENLGAIVPLLQRFADRTHVASVADVLEQARDGSAQLWGYCERNMLRGILATRIHENLKGRFCSIWITSGFDVLKIVPDVLGVIEPWAANMNCSHIEIVGRPGWGKFLEGFDKAAVMFTKRLERLH